MRDASVRAMRVDFVTCDVFTSRPFTGNPLLVVPDARGLTTPQMQAIAREINYSESTFVLPADDPARAYRQRTFVPVKEIPYAGHPTVGTALVLAWAGRLAPPAGGTGSVRVEIEVGFGPIPLDLEFRSGRPARLTMGQGRPEVGPPVRDASRLARLEAGLSLPAGSVGSTLPVRAVSTGNRFLLVPVRTVEDLAAADPDPRLLVSLEKDLDVLGSFLFAFAGGGRIRARCFVPGAGIPEDPATGSAAGPLGIYLAAENALPDGSPRFTIDQGVEMGRASEIGVEVERAPDGTPVGVRVSGEAVKMMTGSLEI